ncbi:MAG: M23 family metallopeptidase [Saprospiraceae bacterium]|nr:M23 family metallopeptidase [Saprospiraceae bacterium]
MSKSKLNNQFVVIIIFAAILSCFSCQNPTSDKKTSELKTDTVLLQPKVVYGINVDSLRVISDKIKANQNLSEILPKYGVSYQTIDELSRKSIDIFDIRKIRAGNKYTIISSNDSLKKAQYFIYESSAISYVVFDLRDSVVVYKGKKEVITKMESASGAIESSLWNDMIKNDINPVLSIELSEVYQWAIDFFGLQKGDKYKVIYENKFVEGKSVGLGKIKAAWFYHANKDFYAFYFVQDSIGDYFDDEANSLKRTFLKAPLRFSRISSRFSNSRYHPVLKIRRPHHGVDYAAPTGTPVQALGDGKVTEAGRKGGYGKYIKIKHNSVYTTGYAHLSGYAVGIKAGTYVNQGDVIGYVGSTGLSTGPHLDFRVYKNGSAIDPLNMESPPAKPVDSVNIEKYKLLVDKMSKKLDAIK